ncbi:MAG: hypothetical protein JHC33_10215, partial [Ignisphaera sp.]|nr:hypothetical protein [Ignisphaera sp.]
MLNRLKMLSGMSGMQKSFSLEEAKEKKDLPAKQADWDVAELEAENVPPTSWTVSQLEKKLESLQSQAKTARGEKAIELKASIASFESLRKNRVIEDSGKKKDTKLKGGQSGFAAVTIGDATGATLEYTKKEIKRNIARIHDNIAELNAALGNGAVISALKEIREDEDENRRDSSMALDAAIDRTSLSREDVVVRGEELNKKIKAAKAKIDRLRKDGKTKEANIAQMDLDEDEETKANVLALYKALVSKSADESAARLSNEKTLSAAERKQANAEARLMGLSGGQKHISTKGLNQTESLVYKEQPVPGEEHALTFNGMLQTAISKGIKNPKFSLFKSAVVGSGGL